VTSRGSKFENPSYHDAPYAVVGGSLRGGLSALAVTGHG